MNNLTIKIHEGKIINSITISGEVLTKAGVPLTNEYLEAFSFEVLKEIYPGKNIKLVENKQMEFVVKE
jgi:hypothetical protein